MYRSALIRVIWHGEQGARVPMPQLLLVDDPHGIAVHGMELAEFEELSGFFATLRCFKGMGLVGDWIVGERMDLMPIGSSVLLAAADALPWLQAKLRHRAVAA